MFLTIGKVGTPGIHEPLCVPSLTRHMSVVLLLILSYLVKTDTFILSDAML
jgi:hypothetical protein